MLNLVSGATYWIYSERLGYVIIIQLEVYNLFLIFTIERQSIDDVLTSNEDCLIAGTSIRARKSCA